MTRNEFMEFVKRMRTAYPPKGKGNDFLSDRDQLNLWWSYLEPLKTEFFLIAEKKYVAENVFPPMIADLMTRYKEIREHNLQRKAELREIFNLARQYYPVTLWTDEDEKAFMTAIRSETFDECKVKARNILQYVVGNSDGKDKTFAEFIGGRRW